MQYDDKLRENFVNMCQCMQEYCRDHVGKWDRLAIISVLPSPELDDTFDDERVDEKFEFCFRSSPHCSVSATQWILIDNGRFGSILTSACG
jgi:hypothetical protein